MPGSPPRMRGKAARAVDGKSPPGITPAYAGKRCGARLAAGHRGDHPRVCGEKQSGGPAMWPGLGSPPRMRGKVTLTGGHAGQQGDHPRVCGEKMGGSVMDVQSVGSPPRMRGKVGSQRLLDVGPGITPAYAGKRLKRSHRIGHFSCILCLFHSVLHRASASGGSRAGPCAPPCLPAQNAVPV